MIGSWSACRFAEAIGSHRIQAILAWWVKVMDDVNLHFKLGSHLCPCFLYLSIWWLTILEISSAPCHQLPKVTSLSFPKPPQPPQPLRPLTPVLPQLLLRDAAST